MSPELPPPLLETRGAFPEEEASGMFASARCSKMQLARHRPRGRPDAGVRAPVRVHISQASCGGTDGGSVEAGSGR